MSKSTHAKSNVSRIFRHRYFFGILPGTQFHQSIYKKVAPFENYQPDFQPDVVRRYFLPARPRYEKVQVGKDQEKAQSERDSHSKNRGGKKPN